MIFFCYGMPKSASSFIFQMTRQAVHSIEKHGNAKFVGLHEIFEGFSNDDYAEMALTNGFGLDEIKTWQVDQYESRLDQLFDRLPERVKAKNGDAVVIKTHLPCSPRVIEAIKIGTVLASATFRHPAEMLLSRMDMGKRKGEVIRAEDLQLLKIDYLNQVNNFYSWGYLPQVRKYYFDDIVIRPKMVVKDIYHHVNSEEDFSAVTDEYLNSKEAKIWQFNKGILNRHTHEMSEEEVVEIETLFSDFMKFINQHKSGNSGLLSE